MSVRKVLIAAVLALGAAIAQAADKVYSETPADEGMASQMLTNWGAPEGVKVEWEADYEIVLAYTAGRAAMPLQVRASSAVQAMQRFMDGVRSEQREHEKMASGEPAPPPLFGCFYKAGKAFVVRQEGQTPCSEPAKAQKRP